MHFLSHKNALKGLQMRCFVVRQKVLTRNQIYALRGGLEVQLRPFFRICSRPSEICNRMPCVITHFFRHFAIARRSVGFTARHSPALPLARRGRGSLVLFLQVIHGL